MLTEVISKGSDSADSEMSRYIDCVELWSGNNSMTINFKNTKEMFLGNVKNNPPASLCFNDDIINTVKCFKLLGINISDDALCALC